MTPRPAARGRSARARRSALAGLTALGLVGAAVAVAGPAAATTWSAVSPTGRACAPSAVALGYSDALDKAVVDGVTVGGLSDLARDPLTGTYAATVDDDGTQPARLYHVGDPAHPHVEGPALVLRRPDGTPYTGTDSDDEGLAVLPDGHYLVSSETEPSIRVYGRDGVQRGQLPVPARFAVAPAGEATSNATLEGLTVSPSGRYVVAAMEGTLSGDLPAGATAGPYRRFLVYERAGRAGDDYRLVKQVGYQVDAGMRVPEVAAYDDGRLVVEEASFSATTGNEVRLYAVTGLQGAPDVSAVSDLATAPASDVVGKQLVSDLVRCPTLGATSPEPQANPLLDNYEGLAVVAQVPGPGGSRLAELALVSDDNFSAGQVTRVLRLAARLP